MDQQDHYEVLEVSRSASGPEIERAYRMALETYSNDSLAGYSIFADGDASAMRDRMETAYRVLSDADARRAYDASIDAVAPPPPRAEPEAAAPPETEPFDDELEDEDAEWTGARLRRARLRRGLELADVTETTKINPAYLHFIEDERFTDLPARVYVRGFLAAFAGCLGLDAGRVCASYLKRYEEGRVEAKRRRFR